MNSAIATLLVLSLCTGTSAKPIREGYAKTYSYHVKGSGFVFIATTRRGISLSDLNDPVYMQEWTSQVDQPPKPFFIRIYPDHIVAIDPLTKKPYSVPMRDVVEIIWQK